MEHISGVSNICQYIVRLDLNIFNILCVFKYIVSLLSHCIAGFDSESIHKYSTI